MSNEQANRAGPPAQWLADQAAGFMNKAVVKGRQVPIFVQAYNFLIAIKDRELVVFSSAQVVGLNQAQEQLEKANDQLKAEKVILENMVNKLKAKLAKTRKRRR